MKCYLIYYMFTARTHFEVLCVFVARYYFFSIFQIIDLGEHASLFGEFRKYWLSRIKIVLLLIWNYNGMIRFVVQVALHVGLFWVSSIFYALGPGCDNSTTMPTKTKFQNSWKRETRQNNKR